jgi:hypothetical protein
MTPRELFNAVRGYDRRQQFIFKAGWEQTRWLGAVVHNTFGGKRKQPREMAKFPWDEEVKDRSKEIELIKERRKWLTR